VNTEFNIQMLYQQKTCFTTCICGICHCDIRLIHLTLICLQE